MGNANRTLDLGELLSVELAAQPAVPGTWLRSVSVLTTTIPSCIVVPWGPEVVATESDVELTALLSRILVSGRCSPREELTLKLVSSEPAQERQVTLVLTPSAGFEVRMLPPAIDVDMPGFSEVSEGGELGFGIAGEIIPRFGIRGLDKVQLVALTPIHPKLEEGIYRTFAPPTSPKLMSMSGDEWRTADDLDLLTFSPLRLAEIRTEKGLDAFPLTSDPERLWFAIDLAAEKPDRYRVRRYFSVPIAR
ncbi:MAG: hypothetical protein FJ095_20155 [Deltaproteobacteria bacterium]|nr:hypothetical protein [Deltaproteobacteria bacterium]